MSDTAPYSTNIVLLHRYGEKELFISQSITVMVHKICDLTKLKKACYHYDGSSYSST